MAILNRFSRDRAGYSGCFDTGNGGLATGERAWAMFSQQRNNQKDREVIHSNSENEDHDFLQVGQAVNVNFGRRRVSARVVRKVACSHNVEVCLDDGITIFVDQNDVEILQNTEGYGSTSQKLNGIANKRNAPLVIDIPSDPYVKSHVFIFYRTYCQ